MTTRRPLRIVTDAPEAIVERLRTEGHWVERATAPEIDDIDLVIAAYAWHLPTNAPNPDAHVDAAVEWMQRRKYAAASKPKKEITRGRTKRTI